MFSLKRLRFHNVCMTSDEHTIASTFPFPEYGFQTEQTFISDEIAMRISVAVVKYLLEIRWLVWLTCRLVPHIKE